jgi:hypothetical protein
MPSLTGTEGPSAAPTTDSATSQPDVIDRPGVPSVLYDKYWTALGQAGQVGTTATIVLPSDEAILAADAGRITSIAVNPDTLEPNIGSNGVAIVVRDIHSGEARSFDTGISVAYGAMSGSTLFWTGRTLTTGGEKATDAGLWAIDLADPAAKPVAIITPGDLNSTYGANAFRSRPVISGGGLSVLTTVIGEKARATQVVNIADLAVATIDGEAVFEVADGVALARRSGGLVLLDLANGSQIGAVLKADEVYRTVAGAGEMVVQYGLAESGVHVSTIDMESGEVRDLLIQPIGVRTTFLSRELSAATLLVLLDDDWALNAEGAASVGVSLLDPATGELQPSAFSIGKP